MFTDPLKEPGWDLKEFHVVLHGEEVDTIRFRKKSANILINLIKPVRLAYIT